MGAVPIPTRLRQHPIGRYSHRSPRGIGLIPLPFALSSRLHAISTPAEDVKLRSGMYSLQSVSLRRTGFGLTGLKGVPSKKLKERLSWHCP